MRSATCVRVACAGLVPLATRTVKGSPLRAAPVDHTHVCEPAAFEQLPECVDRKAEMTIAKSGTDPGLIVGLQIHEEQSSGRPQHADSLGDGAFGVAGVVQRL